MTIAPFHHPNFTDWPMRALLKLSVFSFHRVLNCPLLVMKKCIFTFFSVLNMWEQSRSFPRKLGKIFRTNFLVQILQNDFLKHYSYISVSFVIFTIYSLRFHLYF